MSDAFVLQATSTLKSTNERTLGD